MHNLPISMSMSHTPNAIHNNETCRVLAGFFSCSSKTQFILLGELSTHFIKVVPTSKAANKIPPTNHISKAECYFANSQTCMTLTLPVFLLCFSQSGPSSTALLPISSLQLMIEAAAVCNSHVMSCFLHLMIRWD